ncbi:MAG: hypothetical protein HYW48_09140 [Deltaproteobacteria bacterium]|nr:hypothetical protein [Deltaproteobacteria bacterium]
MDLSIKNKLIGILTLLGLLILSFWLLSRNVLSESKELLYQWKDRTQQILILSRDNFTDFSHFESQLAIASTQKNELLLHHALEMLDDMSENLEELKTFAFYPHQVEASLDLVETLKAGIKQADEKQGRENIERLNSLTDELNAYAILEYQEALRAFREHLWEEVYLMPYLVSLFIALFLLGSWLLLRRTEARKGV